MKCGKKVHGVNETTNENGGVAVFVSDTAQTLHMAAQHLANVCDFAKNKDGAGFNKPDSYLGHFIAAISAEDWTPEITYNAWLMLRKYRKQLAAYGIDFDAIEPPHKVGDDDRSALITGVVSRKGDYFILRFPFNPSFGTLLKAHGGRFVNYYGDKYWRLPITKDNAQWLAGFAKENDFYVNKDARVYTDSPEKVVTDGLQDKVKGETTGKTITVQGETMVMKFEYDPAIVEQVRSLPSKLRQWSATDKTWTIQITKKTVDFAEQMVANNGFALIGNPHPIAEEYERKLAEMEAAQRKAIEQQKKVGLLPNGKVSVEFHYDPALVNEIKGNGRRWNAATKSWEITLTADNAQFLLDFANRHGFYLPDDVLAAIDQTVETHKLNYEQNWQYDLDNLEIPGLKKALRPFQKPAVDYALRNKRIINGDDMGLGKTISTIATIQAANAYPVIIICPASVKYNWKREWENWIDGKKISVIDENNADFDADVIILNYDILSKHKNALMALGAKTIVGDESQYLKNYKAQRTKNFAEIAQGVEYRLLLSGTPMINRPQELISQLQILGRIEDFGGFWNFAYRYCNAYRTRFGWNLDGAANLDELNQKLRQNCFIRRTKQDCLKDLPEKQRSIVFFPIDNRKEYEKAVADFREWLRETAAEDKAFKASIARLPPEEQQAAIARRAESAVMKAQRAERLVKIEKLKQLVAKGKINAIKEWVDNFVSPGEKLVLFATHQETIDELKKVYPNAPVITGDITGKKRQEAVDKFQNDPETHLIIMNTKAGGVGITLTAASNVAFTELEWTPGAHDQAEDRVYRIGQTNAVNAYYLLDDTTIEGDIYKLIERKREIVQKATDGTGQENDGITEEQNIISDLIARLEEKWAAQNNE